MYRISVADDYACVSANGVEYHYGYDMTRYNDEDEDIHNPWCFAVRPGPFKDFKIIYSSDEIKQHFPYIDEFNTIEVLTAGIVLYLGNVDR